MSWANVAGAQTVKFKYHSYTPDFTPDGHLPSTEALNYKPEYHTLEVGPFDYVVVRVYGDVELENGLPLLRRSVGEFQAIPALYLYWMIRRKATDETIAHIKGSVNLLLFLIGGAEIVAARSGLRLALAITDQALFATSFVLEAGPRRLLEEGPNGEKWASVFKAFDAFNLLYGAARIGQGVSLAATDLLSNRAVLRQLKDAEDWKRFSPSQEVVTKEALEKMEKGLDELEKVVGELGAPSPLMVNGQDEIWNSLANIGDPGDLISISAQLALKKVDEIVSKGFLPGWTKVKILAHGKGNYPSPDTYLSKEYITNHLKPFDNGVSFFCPAEYVGRAGDLLGRPDGVFVSPIADIDRLIAKTGGDLTKIESELGIPPGQWSTQKMYRVDVHDIEGLGIRMPTGNEVGANKNFVPGGFTINGQMEAVIDPIPTKRYKFDRVN